MPSKTYSVYDTKKEAAERFAEEMSTRMSLNVRAADDPENAVRGADIIVTVTVADEPIIKDAAVTAAKEAVNVELDLFEAVGKGFSEPIRPMGEAFDRMDIFLPQLMARLVCNESGHGRTRRGDAGAWGNNREKKACRNRNGGRAYP